MASWLSGSISDCWSCWEVMSTSVPTLPASSATVATRRPGGCGHAPSARSCGGPPALRRGCAPRRPGPRAGASSRGTSKMASTSASSRAGADGFGPRPPAPQQRQGVDQDALARPGLPGDDGEARPEGSSRLTLSIRAKPETRSQSAWDLLVNRRVRPRPASGARWRRTSSEGGRCAAAARRAAREMASPTPSSRLHCPSTVRVTTLGETLVTTIRACGRITTGRLVRVCGQMGVSTMASRSGVRMGPPAARL